MVVLLTCKNEEDQIKIEGARVLTRLYFNFSDAQGQLTQSVVKSGRNSYSSKLLWLSSSPAKMKKIQLKMKKIECKQHFSQYKSMGIFFIHSRAANSAVLGRIRLNFKLDQDSMVVLVTCKNEDPI